MRHTRDREDLGGEASLRSSPADVTEGAETATRPPEVDGSASATADGPIPAAMPVGLPPPPPRWVAAAGYRSGAELARPLAALLAGWVVLVSVAAAASLADYRLASRLLDDPLSVTVAQLDTSDSRQQAIGIVWLGAMVLTAIVFMAWMRRSYDNVAHLGCAPPRHARGWVIGGWLVPFVNLFRPKQIVDDLWRASDPDLPEDAGDAWHRSPVSWLLHVWWVLFLTSAAGSRYLDSRWDSADVDAWQTLALVDVVVNLVFAAAAVLALLVVTRLAQRQEERAVRVLPGYSAQTLRVAQRPMIVTGALAAGGLAVFGGAALAFDPAMEQQVVEAADAPVDADAADPAPGEGDSGVGTFIDDVRTGDCWNSQEAAEAGSDEGFEVLAVEVVPCDEPHYAEVFGIATHPGGESAPYPGEFEVWVEATDGCLDRFERHFDVSYQSSTLDVLSLYPTPQSWALGDRGITCSVSDFGGEPLVGPAVAVGPVLAGTDLDVASACDDLVDVLLLNAQAFIDAWESLTVEQLTALAPEDIVPGTERVAKVDTMVLTFAFRLGCSVEDLNQGFAAGGGALTSSTASAEAMINMFSEDGYFDNSLFE